jgi:LmbE family N-acetylglucosaminyl deacetylase
MQFSLPVNDMNMKMSMRNLIFIFLLSVSMPKLKAQSARALSSSEIHAGIQRMKVLGSVLYVAAHPDDENTRLLACLARERHLRTGYLSLTRGDGGQNLIGDEQGIELGLIRTQELLAARRIDGAEQFFTRAFDFGFSKSTDEALKTWGREKILSDVVWVIRKFQPDVIVTRFPEDSRAGHGHHSASGVLAREAFIAAADPNRFKEHFALGVKPWQAKRILWNTFNFGGNNTTSGDQFKMDVGGWLPLLGRSLGEISAESRSQHKSQGFGVPSSRGPSTEYFVHLLGDRAEKDLLDGVDIRWSRIPGAEAIEARIDAILQGYSLAKPSASVAGMAALYREISRLPASIWRDAKRTELAELIAACSGLYLEAATSQPIIAQDDSLVVTLQANNRSGVAIRWRSHRIDGLDTTIDQALPSNRNLAVTHTLHVPGNRQISQPYWLEQEMEPGSFRVKDPSMIGLPENPPSYSVTFRLIVEGEEVTFTRPVLHKYTDPVKGERFNPLQVVPPVSIMTSPGVMLFRSSQPAARPLQVTATANTRIARTRAEFSWSSGTRQQAFPDTTFSIGRGEVRTRNLNIPAPGATELGQRQLLNAAVTYQHHGNPQTNTLAMSEISYDHIPVIRYFYQDRSVVINLPISTTGRKVGYIRGAGDKVPEALSELGFEVTYLGEDDMQPSVLQQFDAIVTGIRAYNIHPWLDARHSVLMEYVAQGGNLVAQYNTNSFAGPVKARIGPLPFNISRGRVTDEYSSVNILDPKDPLLNVPNRITEKDFEGWVQERGIYFAETPAAGYRTVLGMRDPGESSDMSGSLIAVQHGKGRFIYTGLVFFRQLPAGVPGAYRLFANLVSNPNVK